MTTDGTCSFRITSWDEKPYQDIGGGAKLTKARVTQKYEGIIAGQSVVDYLMAYSVDGTARFLGIERIEGRVAGRVGSFVVRHVGAFEGGTARSMWSVVPGAGTGDLTELRGEGTFEAGHGDPASVRFRYSLDAEE